MSLRNAFGMLLCAAVVVIAFLSSPARSQSRDDGSESAASNVQWHARRVEHRGAVLHVLVPETVVASNAVPLNVMLKNGGKGTFQVGETGYLLDCKVSVVDDGGKPVAYSSMGTALFADGDFSQYAKLRFLPGRIRHWQYDIAQAFESFKPGRYRLTLTAKLQFQDPDANEFLAPVTVTAKQIPFTVASK